VTEGSASAPSSFDLDGPRMLRVRPKLKSVPVAEGKVTSDAATVKSRRYGDAPPRPLSLMPAMRE
jgi:hypothetical protein